MQLETVINKLLRYISRRTDELSVAVTSGGIDSMEKYNYIIGQINALEATRQELSILLDNKERKSEGTVIHIKPKSPKT